MRRKTRERATRSSKTDARFTAKIISRTMKAARAEMRMRNSHGYDQKRKWNASKKNDWNIVFQKTRSAIVSAPKTCPFLRQNRLWETLFGAVIIINCFSPVVVCGLWIFIWPVSPVQGDSRLQIGRDEKSTWNGRE